MKSPNQYIPGVCNIGRDEIKKRRKDMYLSLIFLAGIFFLISAWHPGRPWRLIVFLPALAFGISFLQVYYKFCAGFGLKGVFNFGEMGKTFTVEQKEYLRKDRNKALKMIVISFIFAAALALVYYCVG